MDEPLQMEMDNLFRIFACLWERLSVFTCRCSDLFFPQQASVVTHFLLEVLKQFVTAAQINYADGFWLEIARPFGCFQPLQLSHTTNSFFISHAAKNDT